MADSKKFYSRIVPAVLLAALQGTFAGALSGCDRPAAAKEITVKVVQRIPKGVEPKSAAPAAPTVQAGSAEDLARRYQIPVSETQPSIGPADALVTVVTWCDFSSQLCRDADRTMQDLLKQYQGKMRWVFRNLPTRPDYVPAHLYAYAAFHLKGKFWEVRQALMTQPVDKALTLEELAPFAAQLGLGVDADKDQLSKYAENVGTDVRFGDQFGVTRPLGVFVNGRRARPVPAPELKATLTTLINEELANAERMVKAGTSKARLYEDLIKDAYWGIADDPARRAAALAEKEAKDAEAAAASSVATAKDTDKQATKPAKPGVGAKAAKVAR